MASRKEEIRKEIKKKNEKEGLNPEAVNNIENIIKTTIIILNCFVSNSCFILSFKFTFI